MANAKLLPNRQALLGLLPKNAVVAELGVDQGGFSERILKTCTPKKLHLVDAWDTPRYGKDKENAVKAKFASQIDKGQVAVHIGYSTDVIDQFEDGYFDWIYIDTDHSYPTTMAELEGYLPKLKPGGIITGHDYVSGSWTSMVRYGVVEAVHEFCVKNDWELIYLTVEKEVPGSFAVRGMA
ncbi:MAG: class I SAM-dependent methyltransferase [Cyclobacteriaceae bacterium]